jgi:D-glycero-alpha-D-manno-heptose-7-phosphate kinase
LIVIRTPYRISFFGGGTDYPGWYRENGGAVLATAINKHCYITCRRLPPFFEHRIRVVYSNIELCQTIDDIQHAAVREALRHVGLEGGLEIHHDGDLPARSGTGSSSSFTVGMLHAAHGMLGHMPSKKQLADEAIHVEQEMIGETVGSQDQYLTAYGGLNYVTFATNGAIAVHPLVLSQERTDELSSHLMLFYTGIKRTASDVAKTYVEDIGARATQLRIIHSLADAALGVLTSSDDISRFGELLHESWLQKRSLSDFVTNSAVDDIYTAGRSAGAIGGKILGAGGGGFILFFVRPEDQVRVKQALPGLIHVPFEFDYAGSQAVFYEPGSSDYAAEEAARISGEPGAFRELDSLSE